MGLPSPAPAQPKILNRTDRTVTVELSPIRNDNGPVSQLLVIVEYVDNALIQPFDAQHLGSWQDGVPYYIAAELDYDRPEDNRTRSFVVGDGKRYGRYHNAPLNQPNAHVHISLGVVSNALLRLGNCIIIAILLSGEHPRGRDQDAVQSWHP